MLRDPGFVSGAKVPRLHQGDDAHGPLDRVGVGLGIWGCTGPRLQVLHEQEQELVFSFLHAHAVVDIHTHEAFTKTTNHQPPSTNHKPPTTTTNNTPAMAVPLVVGGGSSVASQVLTLARRQPEGLQGQRDESNDGLHSHRSSCSQDLSVERRLLSGKGDPRSCGLPSPYRAIRRLLSV